MTRSSKKSVIKKQHSLKKRKRLLVRKHNSKKQRTNKIKSHKRKSHKRHYSYRRKTQKVGGAFFFDEDNGVIEHDIKDIDLIKNYNINFYLLQKKAEYFSNLLNRNNRNPDELNELDRKNYFHFINFLDILNTLLNTDQNNKIKMIKELNNSSLYSEYFIIKNKAHQLKNKIFNKIESVKENFNTYKKYKEDYETSR